MIPALQARFPLRQDGFGRPATMRPKCCKFTTAFKKCAEGAEFALFRSSETGHLAKAEGSPSFRGRMNQLALGVNR